MGYMCVGSSLVGQMQKRWIDSVNDMTEKKRFECWASNEEIVPEGLSLEFELTGCR